MNFNEKLIFVFSLIGMFVVYCTAICAITYMMSMIIGFEFNIWIPALTSAVMFLLQVMISKP